MKIKFSLFFVLFVLLASITLRAQVGIWEKYELNFESEKTYDNPLYEVTEFSAVFTSASGRTRKVNGFWDGGKTWRLRFMPDETGEWSWNTQCSDKENSGLNGRSGKFTCVKSSGKDDIYKHGAVFPPKGKYYFAHKDGTPFFWFACTAWNGAMKSTPEEWRTYLESRKARNFSVIQLITTQFRGLETNDEGLVAFSGAARISVNPDFFKRIDDKIDQINEFGMLASPALLWAIANGPGKHLNPGYYLPIDEAVLLAKYIVARYQGNHVVWFLAGDGKYTGPNLERWKEIGRRTFSGLDHAPVTMHPGGVSYVGDLFAGEEWYSFMGYQSSHGKSNSTIDWINKGPMSQQWSKLRPMPYINIEPCYEQINQINEKDVRNASCWSLFATPVAGITYGANGIWSWLRNDNEEILNHRPSPVTFSWFNSINLPGSMQMSYISGFFKQFKWWELTPTNDLLVNQPGVNTFNHWVSVLSDSDRSLILLYIPFKGEIELFNPAHYRYSGRWFNPVSNIYTDATVSYYNGRIRIRHDGTEDILLVLNKVKI